MEYTQRATRITTQNMDRRIESGFDCAFTNADCVDAIKLCSGGSNQCHSAHSATASRWRCCR